jgi:hypothetical protein
MMTLMDRVDDFAEAFENCELDKVMAYFTPDAVYTSYDGKRCEGTAAIRKEFSSLFNGKYGGLIFHHGQTIVDEKEKKVVYTWTCEHDLEEKCSILLKPIRFLTKTNKRWEGLDIFIFDEDGEYIKEKQVYCQAILPKIKWR